MKTTIDPPPLKGTYFDLDGAFVTVVKVDVQPHDYYVTVESILPDGTKPPNWTYSGTRWTVWSRRFAAARKDPL